MITLYYVMLYDMICSGSGGGHTACFQEFNLEEWAHSLGDLSFSRACVGQDAQGFWDLGPSVCCFCHLKLWELTVSFICGRHIASRLTTEVGFCHIASQGSMHYRLGGISWNHMTSVGAPDYAPELIKVQFHWKIPLKIDWSFPVEIRWTSVNPLENIA